MSKQNLRHLALISCLIAQGCIARRESLTDLKHTPGKTVFTGNHPQIPIWTSVEEDKLGEATGLGTSIGEKELASLRMPLIVKLQSEVDKLHAVVVKGSGKDIPRPRLIVHGRDKWAANAQVKPILYCLPLEIKWDDALPTIDFLSPGRGVAAPLNPVRMSLENCKKLEKLSDDDATAFISDAVGFDSGCVATKTDSSGKQVSNIDKKCLDAEIGKDSKALVKMVGGGRNLVVTGALNWVFLTPALLKTPEDQLVATIFHELAHYYRAHLVFGRGFDYFYLLDAERNEAQAPKPLERSHPLYQLGLELKGVMFESSLSPETLALLKRAKTERLGFYTAEQEADELALEYLKTMGKKPASLADFLLTYLRDVDTTAFPYPDDLVPSYKTCADYQAKGFPQFVGVGRYDDPHHSLCYRIYNIHREIKVHGY